MREIALIFIIAFVVLLFVRYFSNYVGLVDKPNKRKKHKGNIPLVGGIAIYFSLWVLQIDSPDLIDYFSVFMLCASILIIVGVLDDLFDIPVIPRIIIQILVAIIMISCGLYFDSLGNILFGYELPIGILFGSIITILAVCGAVNAFNMVDGIDGLLGILSCISIGSLAVVFYIGNNYNLALFCICILIALVPYICLNIGFSFFKKYKVFMGDAGSTLIGFIIVWLLVIATQGDEAVIRPITGLWLIAVPLIDMVGVMIRRISIGRSPFKPDRKHLHHIFMRAGFSATQTLYIISFIALLMAVVGIVSDISNIPEAIMFFLYVAILLLYIWSLKRIWKLLVWIRRKQFIMNDGRK